MQVEQKRVVFHLPSYLCSSGLEELRSYSIGLSKALFSQEKNLSFILGTGPSAENNQWIYENFKDVVPSRNFSWFEYPVFEPQPSPLLGFTEMLFQRHLLRLHPNGVFFFGVLGPPKAIYYPWVTSLRSFPSTIFLSDPAQWFSFEKYSGRSKRTENCNPYIEILRSIDLIIVGSESSRKNLINCLDFSPDQIISIPGGFSPRNNLHISNMESDRKLLSRLNITTPFILSYACEEGACGSKNLIQAFSLLPPSLLKKFKLVIMEGTHKTIKHTKVKSEPGFGEIIFMGPLSNQERDSLYRLSALFIYPGEQGFSQAFFEAISHGTPAVAPKNSAISELSVTNKALFDASSPEKLAQDLASILNNASLQSSLFEEILKDMVDHTWEKWARKLWDAWDLRMTKKIGGKFHDPVKKDCETRKKKKKIVCIVPKNFLLSLRMKPFRTVLKELSDNYDFIYCSIGEGISNDRDLLSRSQIPDLASSCDGFLYLITRDCPFESLLNIFLLYPGMAVLLDFWFGSNNSSTNSFEGTGDLIQEALICHGTVAAQIALNSPFRREISNQYPLNKRILDNAYGLIFCNPTVPLQIQNFYPDGTRAELIYLPWPIFSDFSPGEGCSLAQIGREPQDPFACTLLIGSPGPENGWSQVVSDLSSIMRTLSTAHYTLILQSEDFPIVRKMLEETMEPDINSVDMHPIEDIVEQLSQMPFSDLVIVLGNPSSPFIWEILLKAIIRRMPLAARKDFLKGIIPMEAVLEVSAESNGNLLRDNLHTLAENYAMRKDHAQKAFEWLEAHHSPKDTSILLSESLERIFNEWSEVSDATLAASILSHLKTRFLLKRGGEAIRLSWLAANSEPTNRRERLYIDVTTFAKALRKNYITGIQRVIQNLCRFLPAISTTPAYTFRIGLRNFRPAFFLESLLFDPERQTFRKMSSPLSLRPGDRILLPDSILDLKVYKEFLAYCKNRGAILQAIIYDILPLKLPECFPRSHRENFHQWLETTLSFVDLVLCDSRTTAEDLLSFLELSRISRSSPLKIGNFHLGSDLPRHSDQFKDVPSEFAHFFDSRDPIFLMVGTIEPRKNHAFVLSIFETLWSAGHTAKLCIVGREGWKVKSLVRKFRHHPEQGNRFLFLEGASDTILELCYKNSSGLIMASAGEGFGLPLVEAAQKGLPLLVNNLPVFREICEDNALYFSIEGHSSLYNLIRNWQFLSLNGLVPESRKIRMVSWQTSMEELNSLIHGKGQLLE